VGVKRNERAGILGSKAGGEKSGGEGRGRDGGEMKRTYLL